jgi:phosphohistidine swiveling domain-containing protein
VQRFEPIEALSPRRAQGVGEPLRRKIAMARAGLPVPGGFVLPRSAADAIYARALDTSQRPSVLLDPNLPLPDEAELSELADRVAQQRLDAPLRAEIGRVDAELRSQGASALALTTYVVCERAVAERVLGNAQLSIEDEAGLAAAVSRAFAELLHPNALRALRAAEVRDASVALFVQRMVDGMVSGVVYTRHPNTGDPREWLVRAGYGLASAVGEGRVASDVIRVTRDGFVRDEAVVEKKLLEAALPGGARTLREVPAALVRESSLTRASLADVLRVAERAERHAGQPVRVEWSIAEGNVFLLRSTPLPGPQRIARPRRSALRERELWSHSELGEAIPHPLTPLGWSLLRRFARAGLDSAVFAGGVRLDASSELINDVRGRAYVNLGLLTETVCRLPGITPASLQRVGLPVQLDLEGELDRAGVLEVARAALRVYDAHVRFGRRLGSVSTNVAGERRHFAGLDARLLSPEAVERVLRDVEHWLLDVGNALMGAYGLWLATLVGLRTLLVRHLGSDALRLERDLLWGPEELTGVSVANEFAQLARTFTHDSRALAWAESDGAPGATPPEFVREAVLDFAARHRHEGMWLLDPASPRWRETPERLEGALRALLADPMALAFAAERREVARGRRERAEREWRRRMPMSTWPLVMLLVRRLRELTRHRESLTADTAQAVSVIRDIARDASRRLSMRYRSIGPDAGFFLDLDELHAGLGHGVWDVADRVECRRTELRITAALEPAQSRFTGVPTSLEPVRDPIVGAAGSGGAAEGRVVRVVNGSELARLPRAAVLVVPACDVGLCAVLPAVRAVISERGGMLSHGAMLASALGVPVVVGVEGASRVLRDGERVRVDADTAHVERMS